MADSRINVILGARDEASKVVGGLRGQFERFKSDAVAGFGLGAGMASFSAARMAIGHVVDAMSDAVAAASDLQEAESKVSVVFDDQADTIKRWGADSATAFGLSTRAAYEAAGTFGNLFDALELGDRAGAEMSRTLVELAADLASFNNRDINEVLTALQSGIVGETEPMRRLGVNMSAARVEAYALEQGLAATKDQITDAVKVQARYALILQDTANAQGDFARTADGLANKQRIVNAQLENARAKLGEALLPAAGLATDAMLAFADAVLVLAKGRNSGRLADLRHQLDLTQDELHETALAADAADGEWLLSGTAVDSLVDGLFALQGGLEDLGVVPHIKNMKDYRAAVMDMATAMDVSSAEVIVLADEALAAGLSLEEFVRRWEDVWASMTGGEQERQRNLYNAFIRTREAATTAFAAPEAEARDLAKAIEHVANVSFRDLKDEAKDAGRAIRNALAGDANRTIRQLRNEERQLEQQRLKAQRQGKWEAYWLAEARLEEVRAALTARRQARRQFREERAENRQRRQDVNTLIGVLDDLWRTANRDSEIDIDTSAAQAAIARLRTNIQTLFASLGTGTSVTVPTPSIDTSHDKGGRKGDTVRASGGPVRAGRTYLIGERGPELLTMGSMNGYVTPNHQLGIGGGNVYLDGYLVGKVIDQRLGDMYTSAGSGAMSRAS